MENKEPVEFFSQFGMREDVTFRPMYRHQQAMGIADEELGGEIVGVKFTEMKVFYDVYSPYHGIIFDGVVSQKVYKHAPPPTIKINDDGLN